MKKIIVILITFLCMLSTSALSQKKEYPKLVKNNDTTFVIFTLDQAKQIDTDKELLDKFTELSISTDKSELAYIHVIDNLRDQNVLLKVKITELESLHDDKDAVIKNLKLQILELDAKDKLHNDELSNNELIILEKDKKIKKVKRSRNISIIVSILVIILLI